jgi:hypothetical protein
MPDSFYSFLRAYCTDIVFVDKLPFVKSPREIAEDYSCDGNILFSRRSRYAIEANEGGRFTVYRHPRKSSLPPIEVLLWLQLLKKGLTFVHAAGLKFKEKAVIFPAWPEVGKTSLTVALLKRCHNWSFLGDDMIILSRQGVVYPYPRPFAVYSYHIPVFSDYFRRHTIELIRLRLGSLAGSLHSISKIGALALDKIGITEPLWVDFDKVFPSTRIAKEGTLSTIYLLSKSVSSTLRIEQCKKEKVIHHVINVLCYDLLAPFSRDVAVLSYFGFLDFLEALKTLKSVLSDALSKAEAFQIFLPSEFDLKGVVERIESHVGM